MTLPQAGINLFMGIVLTIAIYTKFCLKDLELLYNAQSKRLSELEERHRLLTEAAGYRMQTETTKYVKKEK